MQGVHRAYRVEGLGCVGVRIPESSSALGAPGPQTRACRRGIAQRPVPEMPCGQMLIG